MVGEGEFILGHSINSELEARLVERDLFSGGEDFSAKFRVGAGGYCDRSAKVNLLPRTAKDLMSSCEEPDN